jgi:regulator of sirC expression with transglutaminase-like and TPR domain
VDATGRWRETVQRPETDLPLDEAAILVAAHANEGLDVDVQLRRLDDLAARVDGVGTDGVCDLLFGTLALRGDRETYDDPRNSFVDQVLDRRLGIPISLSVLLIEIGRRCGLDIEGVGMPGHFLARERGEPDVLIDSFDGGRRLDTAGCQEIFRAIAGPEAEFTTEMLRGTGSRAILGRMLTNLDRSYERRNDRRALAWVTRLRMDLPGLTMQDRLDVARRAAGLGWHDRAADIFEELADEPSLAGETASRLRRRSIRLRSSLN